jgi:hypothetical protein
VKKRINTKAQTSEVEITGYAANYCEGNESEEASDGDNDANSEVSENDDTDPTSDLTRFILFVF